MKFLFITSGSEATVFAVAPLAAAVQNAGHEVLLVGNEPVMGPAEAIGVPAFSIMDKPIRHFVQAGPEYAQNSPRDWSGVGRGLARMASAEMEALLDLARVWPPDLIVGGSMSYAAGMLATRLNVPYVRQAEYLKIPLAELDPVADEELQPELKRLGLTGLPDPVLLIDVTPPSLLSSPAPGTQLMRWIPRNHQRRLESWMFTRPEGRPRVLITSGSRGLMFRNPGWSLPNLAEQLVQAGAEVLIAAPSGAAEKFGRELDDFRIGWIPLDVVAPTCDLVVHHGGATTTMTVMVSGVPQLIIPENPPDIPENLHRQAVARSLSGFGAGLAVLPREQAPDQDPADIIAAGCRDILTTPRYAQRADVLAGEIAALPTPAEVMHTLEKIAAA
jgi:UDP:flavonoid glycosyltransferase YjiC (YdhE family)